MGKGLPVTRTIVFSEEAMVTTCEGQWLGCNELTIDERRFKAKVVCRTSGSFTGEKAFCTRVDDHGIYARRVRNNLICT